MTAAAKANVHQSPSRREALNYAFGASIALALAGSCGGLVWFMQQQRISYGEKTGLYLIEAAHVPQSGDPPLKIEDGTTWLVNVHGGLVAFSERCTHEGCRVYWSSSSEEFKCGCCNSEYQIDGTCTWGFSKRNLDRAIVRVTTSHGTVTTPADGSPVSIEGATSVVVDTDKRKLIYGQPRPPRLT